MLPYINQNSGQRFALAPKHFILKDVALYINNEDSPFIETWHWPNLV